MPPQATPVGRLHVLTDFHFQQRYAPAELARIAAEAGADTIQFRQKDGTARERWSNLVPTVAVCRAAGVPLMVDDDLGMALAAGAGGVHLGENDLPVAAARAASPPGFIIGATASTLDAAVAAQVAGADYIGFGPVFATGSKAAPAPVRGLDALAAACRAVRIPVIAIAGITPARVPAVLDAGAYGVAVMTAVSTAAEPGLAVREFVRVIRQAVGE